MANRTTQRLVVFANPFHLDSHDEQWAAGTCLVETEEERFDSMSFVAFRHVRTTMSVRPQACWTWITQTIEIDPAELEDALARDRAPLERAENEGMATT